MAQLDGVRLDLHDGMTPPRRRAGVWLLLWLLAASASASVACRGSDEQAGVGGQSGDEGRRPASSGLGTGGVTSQ